MRRLSAILIVAVLLLGMVFVVGAQGLEVLDPAEYRFGDYLVALVAGSVYADADETSEVLVSFEARQQLIVADEDIVYQDETVWVPVIGRESIGYVLAVLGDEVLFSVNLFCSTRENIIVDEDTVLPEEGPCGDSLYAMRAPWNEEDTGYSWVEIVMTWEQIRDFRANGLVNDDWDLVGKPGWDNFSIWHYTPHQLLALGANESQYAGPPEYEPFFVHERPIVVTYVRLPERELFTDGFVFALVEPWRDGCRGRGVDCNVDEVLYLTYDEVESFFQFGDEGHPDDDGDIETPAWEHGSLWYPSENEWCQQANPVMASGTSGVTVLSEPNSDLATYAIGVVLSGNDSVCAYAKYQGYARVVTDDGLVAGWVNLQDLNLSRAQLRALPERAPYPLIADVFPED